MCFQINDRHQQHLNSCSADQNSNRMATPGLPYPFLGEGRLHAAQTVCPKEFRPACQMPA